MARTSQRRSSTSTPRATPQKSQRISTAPKKKRDSKKRILRSKVLRWVGFLSLCAVVAVFAFVAGGYLGLVKAVKSSQEVSSAPSHPTYIYSKPVGSTEQSTRVIGTIFQGENRKTASLDRMPPSLLDALVAKEDERFREHAGVDIWGIIRALWIDVRAGGAVEGASTITQQYVKNAYLSGDQSLSRKIKEAAIAIETERRYEKNEILGMYLNTVYFGNNAYGVEAAAQTYFSKSTEDLTIGESATLIGLLWSPSSLGSDREESTNQRNLVLNKMRDEGYITRQDHMKALDEKLPERWPKAPMTETGLTGPALTKDFAEFVQEELVNRYGSSTVLGGNLSIYTTLDLGAQTTAQETLYNDQNGYLKNPDDPDAALVSVEPQSGRITAMLGSRDKESKFNLVTKGRRQPGSSFKPFALIAALEQGIDPSTQFSSEKKQYTLDSGEGKTENWEVENYEQQDHGPISLQEALWLSDNSVFTDLVLNANGRGLKDGPEAVVDVAHRLGVTANLNTHPSITLGSNEVSPLDMATAYATIANEGKKVTPTGVEKVVQNEGQKDEEILYAAPEKQEGEQVIAPEVARTATEVMVGDITQGIADKAALGDRPAAGKSGTTENFFDSWFIGFTPQLATGLWMGYEEGGKNLNGLLNIGGQQNGPLAPPTIIWRSYMLQVLKDKPVEKFEDINVPQTLDSTGATNADRATTTPSANVQPTAATQPPPPSGAATPLSTSSSGSPNAVYPGG